MKFGAHYLPTYMPELDGPAPEFYRLNLYQNLRRTAQKRLTN